MASITRDPWFKTTLQHSALGAKLQLAVPHDVFSTQQIDEGTLLLLDHLPSREPATVLDMGCGYGALGLPIAARYPGARASLVDRDLLAVKWAQENALSNQLLGVEAYGSLGYRDLRTATYDWILCNIPARIGRPFIEDLLHAGRARLNEGGELRVVVINDLIPTLLDCQAEHAWPLVEVKRGPRHSIFSLSRAEAEPGEGSDLYFRDQVDIATIRLDRPFDLGGDDPMRVKSGLPALIDALPKRPSGSVLCFRCGYGALPLIVRSRTPESQVTAADRDLLATTFTRRNAERLGLGGERLQVQETADLASATGTGRRFDLILGELSPSAGSKVAESELQIVAQGLNPGGQALLLCLEKLDRQWVRPFAQKTKLSIHPLLVREGYVVLGLRGVTGRPARG